MPPKTATIIGGGIAGASVAYALHKRGIKSTVIESKADVALGASGNPIGLVYPFLTKHKTVESEFSLLAFSYFLEVWEKENLAKSVSFRDGLYFLLFSEELKDRYIHALPNHAIPEEEIVVKVNPETNILSLFLSKGKTIAPRELVETLFSVSSPRRLCSETFLGFKETEENVQVLTDRQTLTSDYLFICNAHNSKEIQDLQWLPTKKVRGQLIVLENQTISLGHSLMYGDYVTSPINGEIVIGASFDEFKTEEETRLSETLALLDGAAHYLPEYIDAIIQWKQNAASLKTRISFRHQSEDRRPIVGRLADLEKFQTYLLSSRTKQGTIPPVPEYNRVGVTLALGSRGLTHALFSAEIATNLVLGETNQVSEKLLASVSSSRFLLRMWKRGQLKID